MGQISRKLRKIQGGYAHYCPGCDHIHMIHCDAPSGPNWLFSGDVEHPTFGPSVRIFRPGTPESTDCHYFIIDGRIQFCGDSSHSFKGQTIDLPDLPERFSDENFHWGD